MQLVENFRVGVFLLRRSGFMNVRRVSSSYFQTNETLLENAEKDNFCKGNLRSVQNNKIPAMFDCDSSELRVACEVHSVN